LLLKGTENDPLQKAKLIKDIVYSISLIPDSITRTIYAKKIAATYELTETMIAQEITKLRAGKFADEVGEPWVKDVITSSPNKPNSLLVKYEVDDAMVEKELVRLMLKFGNKEVVLDPNGEKIQVSVNELVIQELTIDDLSFTNKTCYEIFGEITDGVAEGILYTYNYFLKSSNPEVQRLTAELIGIDEELSPKWASEYRIYTKQEDSDLLGTMFYAIYSFKQSKITAHIEHLRSQLAADHLSQEEQMEILAEQMAYEKIKQTFSEKLGRIIIK
jgi:DNA primase